MNTTCQRMLLFYTPPSLSRSAMAHCLCPPPSSIYFAATAWPCAAAGSPPLPPFFMERSVGRARMRCRWNSCRHCRNSVRLRLLLLVRSAVPNTAASCASSDSCARAARG